jgi:transcriptional regulator with XRE-family HTH domain
MATRTRAADEAARRLRRQLVELGGEVRAARHAAGLTQRAVAAATRTSPARISLLEQGRVSTVAMWQLTHVAATVGLRLSCKAYPVGAPIRDAAQVGYIERFLARIGAGWSRLLEAPIPLPGDLRAVDVLLRGGGCVIAVEVITRLADVQAQLRAAMEKARDIGANRLIIVLAGTHANRRALDAARGSLPGSFVIDTRGVMADLAARRDPRVNAIVLL